LIKTVSYEWKDSLQKSVFEQGNKQAKSIINKPFTKQNINNELDKIVSVFKQNGYYYYSRENIYVYVDSINKKTDWEIVFKQRNINDSNTLRQFFCKNINYYLVQSWNGLDTNIKTKVKKTYPDFIINYDEYLFSKRAISKHNFIDKKGLYNENNFYKTINAFSKNGAWNQIDGRVLPSGIDSLNINFYLSPSKRQNLSINLEGSRNTGDIASGNLIGFGGNVTLLNRNIYKSSIQQSISFRTGFELSSFTASNAVQSFLASLNYGLIIPDKSKNKVVDQKQQLINLNASYTDRFKELVLFNTAGMIVLTIFFNGLTIGKVI
jgi:outer membrane protein insertion porin family